MPPAATFAALSALLAFLEARGLAEPVSVQVGSTLVLTGLVFLWFWLDSESRSYKRSPFLSTAVIAVAFEFFASTLVEQQGVKLRYPAILDYARGIEVPLRL